MKLIEQNLSLEEAVRRAAAEPGSVGFIGKATLEIEGVEKDPMPYIITVKGKQFIYRDEIIWEICLDDFEDKYSLYDLRPEAE